MTDQPPQVRLEPARESFWDRASVVWLVPIAALVIALGIALNTYFERGPLIEITFEDASGVVARETELKYRDVSVGLVEDVGFTEDLERVLVSVRLDKEVAPYVDDEAEFWVVSPEVTTRGVSGLSTVLSGVFIEGLWDAVPGAPRDRFDGRADAPLIAPGEGGLMLELRAAQAGGLAEDTPILFKGIEVGRVGPTRVELDGSAAVAEAVIYPPYDALITTETRFWDTSGFTFSITGEGAEIDFDSIASLLSGGIAFETLVEGGVLAAPGAVYEVYEDEADARQSIYEQPAGRTVEVAVVFEDSVSGLTPGAPVEMLGVRVGTVRSVTGIVDETRFGDRMVRLLAVLAIEVAPLGLQEDAPEDEVFAYLEERAAEGMRGRLASQGLLSGGLKVEFQVLAEPAEVTLTTLGGHMLLPTTEGQITDIAATAEGMFARINALPIEDVLNGVIDVLASADTLLSGEDLQAVPGEVRGLLGDARAVVGSEAVQALPGDVSALLEDLRLVAGELRGIAETLQAEDGIARLLAAVDAAGAAAEQIGAATEGVPALVAEIEAVAAKANALPLEDLVTEASALVAAGQALIASEAAQGLPAALADALDELSVTLGGVQTVVAEVGDANAVERLLAAVDAAGEAAAQIGAATEGVPALVAEIEAVAAKANALPLEDLVSEVSALVAAGEALIAGEAAQGLPEAVTAALDELSATLTGVQGIVADLEDRQAVARLLEAVDAAGAAAAEIGAATEGVPALVAEIEAVAEKAGALPLEELVTELTELTGAAQAVLGTEAARALPESLGAALDELTTVLAEVREGGAVENVNATLDSARRAADAVAAGAESVPDVMARIERLIAQAEATLAGLDPGSDLSRQATAALRDVQAAAEAVTSLARTLERRPNSIIIGR